jgi:3-oxoacyl-[acyl-carrier-protein] synthase-3
MFFSNIARYGNTSAASIPIALCEAINQGRIQPNDYIAFVGFGGGLTWASMVVKWGSPVVEDRSMLSFNRQRLQVSYSMAWGRARLNRWIHQLTEMLRRIRPQRGRIDRLRRKVDQHDFQ